MFRKRKMQKWLDECRLASMGVVLATKERSFLISASGSFIVFGTLLSLLSDGTASFQLMAVSDLFGILKIIWDGFLGLFGVGRNFLDWATSFGITFLQSILIGLVILIWRKRHPQRRKRHVNSRKTSMRYSPNSRKVPSRPNTNPRETSARPSLHLRKVLAKSSTTDSDNIQSVGLVTGLAILGTGCPTCGTTLLTPLIGTLLSGGGVAVAGAISGFITFGAVILALFTLRRIGLDAYVLITSERFLKKRQSRKVD